LNDDLIAPASAAVAPSWAAAATMTRTSRLNVLFIATELNGIQTFKCKSCGGNFTKTNAYRHSRPDSPKHCPYLFSHDNEEVLQVIEWVPQVRPALPSGLPVLQLLAFIDLQASSGAATSAAFV
jgi:hypothetical protein